jgi:hypothetical protein
MTLTWPLWKAHWRTVLATATVAAALEASGLALFLYMFIQNPTRILPVVGASLLIFLCFHVGISALHAKLISHPGFAERYAIYD